MSLIVHKRVLGQRVQALIKHSDPDLKELADVVEALADVMADVLESPCKIVIKLNAGALQKAIDETERKAS